MSSAIAGIQSTVLPQVLYAASGATDHGPPWCTLTLAAAAGEVDYWPMLFVLLLATFVGLGIIARVSRLLHTPLMSLTNAISAIAVVGSIMVTGGDHGLGVRLLGAVAVCASAINIVSGFLITDRMLRFFKQQPKPGAAKGSADHSPGASSGASAGRTAS